MKISIIIPTKNRDKKLVKVLKSLEIQTFHDFEVIIVNDGSGKTDASNFNLDIREFNSFGCGVSAARNLGIRQAKGNLLIFIGDDTYAVKNFVEEHFEYHQQNKDKKIAIVGLIKWSKNLKHDLIYDFLDQGIQFDFKSIKKNQMIDYYHFYTANLSILKKNIDFFDETFKQACYEDVELAFRLSKKGLTILFNPKAIVYHDHVFNDKLLIVRAKTMGKTFQILKGKIPEIQPSFVPNSTDIVKLKIYFSLSFIKSFKLKYYHYLYKQEFIKSYYENFSFNY